MKKSTQPRMKNQHVPFLKYMLLWLQTNGLNPLKDDKFNYVLARANIVILWIFLGFYIAGFASLWEDLSSIEQGNLIAPCFEMMLMAVTMIIKKKELKRCIGLLESFWPLDKFGQRCARKLRRIHNFAHCAAMVFIVSGLVISVLSCCMNMFRGVRGTMIFEIYQFCDPNRSPCFEVVNIALFVILYYLLMPIGLHFVGLFVTFIGYACVGAEHVKIALLKLDTTELDDAMKELGDIVHQHNLILKFVRELRNIFGSILLLCFLLTSGCQIISFYTMNEEGAKWDLNKILQSGTLIVAFSLNILFYCLSGTIIKTQLESIGNAAYSVNWYAKTHPNVRKALALIIERTQRNESITIGHMTELNLELFVWVTKGVFSVAALLRQTSN